MYVDIDYKRVMLRFKEYEKLALKEIEIAKMAMTTNIFK